MVDRDLLAAKLAELHDRMQQTAAALQRAVGLRDGVAHGYAGLDVERCFHAAKQGLTDLETFAREVSAWAQAQLG